MATPEDFYHRTTGEFGAVLQEMIDNREITDFSPERTRVIVDAAISAVQRVTQLHERLGGFHRTDQVRALLGNISRQAVHDRVVNKRLLRVETSDGELVYPAFQFSTSGSVFPRIVRAFKILLEQGDPWTVTYWLTARVADLGNRTPAEVLALADDPDQIDRVFLLARADAAAWASINDGSDRPPQPA